MSLMINGMDMPERGIHHGAIVISETGNHLVVNSNPYNKCFVLSEIPTPHGRLIDADKLLACLNALEYIAHVEGGRPTFEEALEEIAKSPTIIEAEE